MSKGINVRYLPLDMALLEVVISDSSMMSFPFRCTKHFLSLIDRNNPEDPVSRQVLVSESESVIRAWEKDDPLDEGRFTVLPGLVRRYVSRAILKLTDECAVHCRFCFRKANCGLPAHYPGTAVPGQPDLQAAADYCAEHPEIRELLVTGGDPLTLSDSKLAEIFVLFRKRRPDLVLRLNTRIPVAQPSRITPETAAMLSGFAPLWLGIHVNHPAELGPLATADGADSGAAAVSRLAASGVGLLSQTVLLAGVNDNAEVLSELFNRLVSLRVKPYYLFQLDPAPGTSHFMVKIGRGLEIVRELRARLSGLAMPVYSLDLPGGGGKVALTPERIVRHEPGWVILRDDAGKEYGYPDP